MLHVISPTLFVFNSVKVLRARSGENLDSYSSLQIKNRLHSAT